MTKSTNEADRHSTFPEDFQDTGNRSALTGFDVLVFSILLIFGAVPLFFYQRLSDSLGDTVFFADCARFLLAHGSYGINGHSETTQPPGLSAILAILFAIFGYSYAICLKAMAAFELLGVLAAYVFLRRFIHKSVAAVICVLLITSPSEFQTATQSVWPCFPVFFTTMVALLAFEECEKAPTRTGKIIWVLVLTVAMASSLMIATASLALLAAMAAAITFTFFRDGRMGWARLKTFLPVFAIAIVVQGYWMHRKPDPLEWPLAGYPGPYLQQLKVKSGNDPELGMATLADIPVRIETNLFDQVDKLSQLVMRHGVNTNKTSVLVVPILGIAIGWGYCLFQTGGRRPLEWYFAGYEFIYLMWPWRTEPRFLIPIAPLACFYLWNGIKATPALACARPRLVGIALFPLAVFFSILGGIWIHAHWSNRGQGNYLVELLEVLWLLSAAGAAWMAYTGLPLPVFVATSGPGKWLAGLRGPYQASPRRIVQCAAGAIVLLLVGIGLSMEARIARDNLQNPDLAVIGSATEPLGLDVESALWVRSHTPATSVVMARHVPVVFHYSGRAVVWFAPISNPDVLMQGIVRHGVDYVIVIKHRSPYYLPDDDYCFDRLLTVHGDAFRMVFRDSNARIYQVEKKLATSFVSGHPPRPAQRWLVQVSGASRPRTFSLGS